MIIIKNMLKNNKIFRIIEALEYKKVYTFSFILLLFLGFFILLKQYAYTNYLTVIYFDVGQGSSSLIITPKNKKILIDTGPNYAASQKIENYTPYFSKKLDILLLTHGDFDHVGGANDIFKEYQISNLFLSSGGKYTEFNTEKSINFYRLNSGQKLISSLNNINFEILNPSEVNNEDENNNSLVNKVDFGNFEFIFMGDAGKEVERRLVSQGFFSNNKEKILLVGHHGSNTSRDRKSVV